MQIASSREYYGEFQDALKGEFFDAKPRPMFRLACKFRFIDPNGLLWTVPAKKEVDGASIPQPFWSFIGGPFDGDYIKASVVHDYYCDEKSRTEHDTHRNFYYGMRASGVAEWKAKFMYWAVATFGPKWIITSRVIHNLKCSSVGGNLTCTQIPKVKEKVTVLPTIDLGDPDILAAVLSKASTVARSLKTTDGDVLDISDSGQVAADLEAIANNATYYRSVFASKDFLRSPEQLGVLSQWNAAGLDQVKLWENNSLPMYNDATILKPSSIKMIEFGNHFKLEPNSEDLLRNQINIKSLKMESIQSRKMDSL